MRRFQRLSWDGEGTPRTIYDVWDFISSKLRQLRNSLREIDDQFYGGSDRNSFVNNANASLKTLLTDNGCSTTKVYSSLLCTRELTTSERQSQTPGVRNALEEVLQFVERVQNILPEMDVFKTNLCQNVLRHLENYCYDYHKLGTTDDSFYKQLRVRIVRMKDLLGKFDIIASGLRGNSLYCQHFCDDKFSEEIAIEFDCETFPVLRACPDMIQKLYVACDIAQDWLRSDKVYLEEIEKQIETTKRCIKEKEDEYELVKLEYSKIFSSLKQRQNDSDYSEYADESIGEAKNSLCRMEAARQRLQMEVVAVSKLLLNCNDSLRIRGLRSTASPNPSDDDTPGGGDEVDGCNPERVGLASSRYRERAHRDTKIYSNKLQEMKQRLYKLQAKIRRKHENLRDLQSASAEVERLTRKLKLVARNKSHRQEELHILNDHLRQLEKMLSDRKYPKPHLMSESLDEPDHPTAFSLDLNNSGSEFNFPRKEGALSSDLRRAFRLVKNNIGYAWKDLSRTLPYSPHKGLTEINNDIRAIEHENPGHLKEQAYQCLIRWYNHNGCNASLRDLTTSLREIDENRLADKLQGYIPDGVRLSCELSPRTNDSGID